MLLGVWQRKKACMPIYVLETLPSTVLDIYFYGRIAWGPYTGNLQVRNLMCMVFYNCFDQANISLDSYPWTPTWKTLY